MLSLNYESGVFSMLDFDTILYFAYMDSYENEDDESRSIENNYSARENEAQQTKNDDDK